MKYTKYLFGLIILGLIAAFIFFATIEIDVPQEEIRIGVPKEVYSNDS